jgi:hypothetical protein
MSNAATKKNVVPPRGMSERQAAAYLDVSPGTFRKMVRLGLIPPPLDLPGIDRRIHDRLALDRAIEARGGAPQSTEERASPLEPVEKVVL